MGWVEAEFGRKQGLLSVGRAQVRSWLGGFARYEQLRGDVVGRWVFVCQGNICRSAYAQARATSMGLPSASFGLGARDGDPADPRAREVARRRGVELGAHRARSSSSFTLTSSDLLIAMEPAQAERLERLAQPVGAQVTLLGLWSHPQRAHLQDPFGLSEAYFETCFDVIDRGIRQLAQKLGAAAPVLSQVALR